MARLSAVAALAATVVIAAPKSLAFAPPSPLVGSRSASPIVRLQHDTSGRAGTVATSMMTELVADVPSTLASAAAAADALSASSSSNLLSFADQGQNLAGIFFQASLLPYLLFLYFLGFRGNRTPNLGNFGWQYLLLFVLGTIPSGIITKSVYGQSLANVDWLHGGAEALLTATNVLIVLGFREAMTNPDYTSSGSKFGSTPKIVAGVVALLFAVACATGTSLGFEAHSPFLFGIGNLPDETVLSLPFGESYRVDCSFLHV